MTSRATPNLPSNDFDATERFYVSLGFVRGFRDEGWMILTRDGAELEFLPLEVDPRTSIASCCLRTDDLDALHAVFSGVGLPVDCWSIPRLTPLPAANEDWREFALIDPDGNLVRCIQM